MILTPDEYEEQSLSHETSVRELLNKATDARMAVKDGVQREANEIARAQVLATLSLSSAVMGVLSQIALVKIDDKELRTPYSVKDEDAHEWLKALGQKRVEDQKAFIEKWAGRSTTDDDVMRAYVAEVLRREREDSTTQDDVWRPAKDKDIM